MDTLYTKTMIQHSNEWTHIESKTPTLSEKIGLLYCPLLPEQSITSTNLASVCFLKSSYSI